MSAPFTLDELLLAHAAGALPEALGVLVATHMSLKPESRRRYAELETLGGVLLDDVPPEPLREGALEAVLGRLDEASPSLAQAPPALSSDVPSPLAAYLPGGLASLRWRRYGTIREARLSLGSPKLTSRLIEVRPGDAIPDHAHDGNEVTLVLKGAYTDVTGRYARGDVEIADPSLEHRLTAEPGEPCLCLTVSDAQIRLLTPLGRLLNLFVRF